MSEPRHSKQTVELGIHIVHAFEPADATARLALPVTAADIGKIARQLDTGDFYILRSVSPAVWEKLGGLGSPSIMLWGDDGILTSTTTRYLTPGYDDGTAETTPAELPMPPGTYRAMRVRQNTAGVGAATITYRLEIDGVGSALLVAMANTAQNGSDLVNAVVVAVAHLARVAVTKSAAITTSPDNITCSVEFVPA